jgi:hypothetical protein
MLVKAVHWGLEAKLVDVEAQVGCGGSRNEVIGTDMIKPLRFNGSMSWTVFIASLRP